MSFEQFREPTTTARSSDTVKEWLIEQNKKTVLAEINGGGKIPAPVRPDDFHQLARGFPNHAAAVFSAASSSRSISNSKFGLGECPSSSGGVIPVQRKKTLSPTAKYLFFAPASASMRASVIPARLPIRTSE